jgi:hypothetical protein
MKVYFCYLLKNDLWARGMTQVVECLPGKCKAHSSTPSTAKKINRMGHRQNKRGKMKKAHQHRHFLSLLPGY